MKTMSHDGEPRRTTVVNEAGWGRSSRGDSTGQGGCRSSLLGHPARSFFRARDVKIGKPPVEAARAVDAKNAPTAPWKTAQNAVSHSSHRPLPVSLVTGKVSPMFPVNFVTYVPGCTRPRSWLEADRAIDADAPRRQQFLEASACREGAVTSPGES